MIKSGFSLYTRRCIFSSLEGFLVPWSTCPSKSTLISISSVIYPLLTPVGVVQRVVGETLQVIFPSLDTT